MGKRTLTDAQTEERLIAGRQNLLSGAFGDRPLYSLRRHLQSITGNVYILRFTEEQGQQLFDILVDGRHVVRMDLPAGSDETAPSFRKLSVESYLAITKSRSHRKTIEIALRLARPD